VYVGMYVRDYDSKLYMPVWCCVELWKLFFFFFLDYLIG